MMKLIGANQSFIRGPFLVEAVMYGFIAALISTGLGVWAVLSVNATLSSYQISIQPTIDLLVQYGAIVALSMIIIGAIIGMVSSLFATYKYLKI